MIVYLRLQEVFWVVLIKFSNFITAMLDLYLYRSTYLASLTQMSGKCHMRSTKEIKFLKIFQSLFRWKFNLTKKEKEKNGSVNKNSWSRAGLPGESRFYYYDCVKFGLCLLWSSHFNISALSFRHSDLHPKISSQRKKNIFTEVKCFQFYNISFQRKIYLIDKVLPRTRDTNVFQGIPCWLDPAAL